MNKRFKQGVSTSRGRLDMCLATWIRKREKSWFWTTAKQDLENETKIIVAEQKWNYCPAVGRWSGWQSGGDHWSTGRSFVTPDQEEKEQQANFRPTCDIIIEVSGRFGVCTKGFWLGRNRKPTLHDVWQADFDKIGKNLWLSPVVKVTHWYDEKRSQDSVEGNEKDVWLKW